ncbi:hypothetical protein HaLaN_18259, partial [Haematococcus lacustris]
YSHRVYPKEEPEDIPEALHHMWREVHCHQPLHSHEEEVLELLSQAHIMRQ